MIFHKFFLKTDVNPIGQHLQFSLARGETVAPASVGCDDNEIEITCPKGAHIGSAPKRLGSQIFRTFLRPGRINFGGEPVVCDGPAIEQESDALFVAAAVVNPVRINYSPSISEVPKDVT